MQGRPAVRVLRRVGHPATDPGQVRRRVPVLAGPQVDPDKPEDVQLAGVAGGRQHGGQEAGHVSAEHELGVQVHEQAEDRAKSRHPSTYPPGSGTGYGKSCLFVLTDRISIVSEIAARHQTPFQIGRVADDAQHSEDPVQMFTGQDAHQDVQPFCHRHAAVVAPAIRLPKKSPCRHRKVIVQFL